MFRNSIRIRYRNLHIMLVLALLLLLSLAACGGDDDGGGDASEDQGIVISDVWSRPTMLLDGQSDATAAEGEATMAEGSMDMGGTNSAVYMTIENHGDEDDLLVSASTEIAESAELHSVNMDNGVMQMRPVEGGIEIPAGGSEEVVLEPGGLHMMLINIDRSLEVGDTFEVTLEFEKAGTMTIDVEVRDQ